MNIETICRVDVQLDAKMCRRVSTEKNKQIRVIQISRYKYNNNKNNNKRLRIYGSHIFELRIKTWMKVILAVMCTTWAVVKTRPERCTGIAEVMGSNPVQA